jgi:hypothetical protein
VVGNGYTNHRVIVFDATTGAYKRHCGAYGAIPDDAKQQQPGAAPSKQFANPHGVRRARDGIIHVCDRPNNRIQVFESSGKFLREFFIQAKTLSSPLADIAISRDAQQRHLMVVDGSISAVYILARADGKKLGAFSRPGRQPREFRNLHNIAIDSMGNLYAAKAGFGRRVQRFTLQ